MWLLASARVGRLIFTLNALPAVRLMNFALAGGGRQAAKAPGYLM